MGVAGYNSILTECNKKTYSNLDYLKEATKKLKAVTFGAIMQACRERMGFTQEHMAELMDRTQSCISKYEKGKKVPDMQTLMRWADVTNAREVIIAFMYGMEGITIAQNILSLLGVA